MLAYTLGIHRVYEKMMERMQEHSSSITGFKKTLAEWAKKKALRGNQKHSTKVCHASTYIFLYCKFGYYVVQFLDTNPFP